MKGHTVFIVFVLFLGASTLGLIAAIAAAFTFWAEVSATVLVFSLRYTSRLQLNIKRRQLLALIALLIPFGLVMDIVHECGHALWGTLMGGKLVYLKIAYFELYPRLAATSQFDLGLTKLDGITYGSFGYGLMLLGGSMTTSIVSWILGLILMSATIDSRTKVTLQALGLFGIMDLPLYVVLPQIGLRHWLFLGGDNPEPLRGARAMGFPDPLFYFFTLLSSVGLLLLYSENLRIFVCKAMARVRITNVKACRFTGD